MYYSNDPVADAERYEAEKEEYIEKLPVCCNCGEHITGDYLYKIGNEFYCEDCIENLRECTDNFID